MSNLLGRGPAESRTCRDPPPAARGVPAQRGPAAGTAARGGRKESARPEAASSKERPQAPEAAPGGPCPGPRAPRALPSPGPPAQPAHLLRLLPQRDAHGPEARLQLGNVHPAVLVEVQLSEEVGVAGVAIPVPVAGGRRQEEGSQQLEHVGPGQTRSARDSAGWARIRHRPGCCQRPQLLGEGRGERRALPARQREGGRGAAGLAPPVPPPR